jgi:hypothetical protein
MTRVHVLVQSGFFLAYLCMPGRAAEAQKPRCLAFATADGTFTELQYPGATATIPLAINNRGDIVGFYLLNDRPHSFVFRQGEFSTIDVPPAHGHVARDINDAGTIVGNYDGHGYIVHRGVLTTIDAPGAFHTEPSAINNAGVVGGVAVIPNEHDGLLEGFLYHRALFETIAVPNAVETSVGDVTANGTLLLATNEGKQYLRVRGEFQPIETCRRLDTVLSITNQGFQTGMTLEGGMVVGYTVRKQQYTFYRYPGATSTVLRHVNASGIAVGEASDPARGIIGFVYQPK